MSSLRGRFYSAAYHGDTEGVVARLAEGANVHDDNDYALQAAVIGGHVETVKVLLEAGANVHLCNDLLLARGHSRVARWGNECRDEEMVALFEKYAQGERNTGQGCAGRAEPPHP
jgi:hypothetical protein